jgi:hypothetical protein
MKDGESKPKPLSESCNPYAVGDVGAFRENPEYPYKEPIFALSAPITKKADIVFCQLETILSKKPNRRYYNRVSHPDNAQQLTYAGFMSGGFICDSKVRRH